VLKVYFIGLSYNQQSKTYYTNCKANDRSMVDPGHSATPQDGAKSISKSYHTNNSLKLITLIGEQMAELHGDLDLQKQPITIVLTSKKLEVQWKN
jgi:hypothetical protein